MEKMGSHM
jgi:hypothetical protein